METMRRRFYGGFSFTNHAPGGDSYYEQNEHRSNQTHRFNGTSYANDWKAKQHINIPFDHPIHEKIVKLNNEVNEKAKKIHELKLSLEREKAHSKKVEDYNIDLMKKKDSMEKLLKQSMKECEELKESTPKTLWQYFFGVKNEKSSQVQEM